MRTPRSIRHKRTQQQATVPGELPAHMLLQWHITEECNLRCTHCYQQDARVEELGWEGLLEVARQFGELVERVRSRRGQPTTAHVTLKIGRAHV